MTRIVFRERVSAVVLAGSFLLPACGGNARTDSDTAAAGPTSPAGAASGGAASAGGAAGSTGSRAGELSIGSAGELQAPVDIRGSWGMFGFEDPVGITLLQEGGVLSGGGCAAGVPGPQHSGGYCGELGGDVRGRKASFGFDLNYASAHYSAEVTVSADGQRMAGRFQGIGPVLWSTAWLRVPAGAEWLPTEYALVPEELGKYELRLTSADSDAQEYEPNRSYFILYLASGIAGDLGAFFQTEIARAPGTNKIVVGPVPATLPELPVALTLEVADQQLRQVTAVTASGHRFTFQARIALPP